MSEPVCTCPATSEYDPPCPAHGILGIGVCGRCCFAGETKREHAEVSWDEACRGFDEAWKEMEARGYAYGAEALVCVRLGWAMARGYR